MSVTAVPDPIVSRLKVNDTQVRLFGRPSNRLIATRNEDLRNAFTRSAFDLADGDHSTEEKGKKMGSRIPVLVGLVLLVVTLSVVDVTIFPAAWSGALPYIIVGLILFMVMSRGGCCGRSCRRKTDGSQGASPAA